MCVERWTVTGEGRKGDCLGGEAPVCDVTGLLERRADGVAAGCHSCLDGGSNVGV